MSDTSSSYEGETVDPVKRARVYRALGMEPMAVPAFEGGRNYPRESIEPSVPVVFTADALDLVSAAGNGKRQPKHGP